MAKRGEVVDAETAAKIAYTFNNAEGGMDDPFRAIIWPQSKLNQIENVPTVVNLLDHPCRRNLIHLLCMDDRLYDRLVWLATVPTISDYGYMITIMFGTCNYDGDDLTGYEGYPLAFSDDEAIKIKMQAYLAQKNKSTRFSSVESLLAQPDLTPFEERSLFNLRLAIALEQFAFSPRTVIKQRPTLKQAMNRNPVKREWPAIEIVNLRLPEKKENPDAEGRELTIRFYVKGHLRRQWRPSTKDHKLIWIEEHIRGPENAPLKPKPTKIYKVTK